MNALLRKEIRLLLPVWVAALAQATLPALFFWGMLQDRPPTVFIIVPFSLGILLAGLSSFGMEFGTGTFSILMAQPVARIRLWQIKTRLLAFCLFTVWISLLLCLGMANSLCGKFIYELATTLELAVVLGLVTIAVFSSVLWTTLLFRQVAAAFWFTILVPAFIATMTWSFWQKRSETQAFVAVSLILLVYSIAGYLLARWMFLRAQDVAWTGGNISLPAWLGFQTQAPAQLTVPKLKPLRALLRKEFQSHHITLLIGGVLLISHLVGIAVRKLEYDPTNPHKAVFEIFGFWWLLWFALPMIIGATVVAEERKLGTLESQLCLPVKRGWQFAVKFLVALILGIILGGVMPGVCEGFASWLGVPGEFPAAAKPEFWIWLKVCCLIATGTVLVSIYASTLTRNLLQALGTAVISGMLLATFGMYLVMQDHSSSPLWMGPLGIYLGLPMIITPVLWLAFKNFKSLQVGMRLWRRNLFVVLAAMISIVVLTTLIWNRAWELGMTLEPTHGPAQLTGPVRPGIHLAWGGKIFALLPDGRIWVENKYELRETGEWENLDLRNGKQAVQKVKIQVPLGGTCLPTSNWVQLAGSNRRVVALAANGSLWRLFLANQTNSLANLSRAAEPERLGTDSDWQAVVGGWSGFVALKQDGSLWTWKRESEIPAPIGRDSDWTAIFASRQSFAGIKRDGSVWKWGHLQNGPAGYDKDWKQEQPEPVQWYPAGGDWLAVEANDNFDLFTKRDGTLWACGQLPENLLGKKINLAGPHSRFSPQPVQIGADSDFADIKADWSSLVVLKKTGTIYHNNFNLYERVLFFWGRIWNQSRHSDWIAIQQQEWSPADLALAGDGTLCAWRNPLLGSNQQLLGPSRKPLWTLNILAEGK